MVTDLDQWCLAVNEKFSEIWGVDASHVVLAEPTEVREMVR